MGRELTNPLTHDSVWSFIEGADETQLRTIQAQTAYELRMAAAADTQSGAVVNGALCRELSVASDEELAQEHDRIAAVVHRVVPRRWAVETLSFHAGAVIPTYQRLEWVE